MTLVRKDTLAPWRGEVLDGWRHPPNIEQLWSEQEIDAVGLATALPPVIPAGKQRASGAALRYERQGAVVREAFDLVDVPVAEPEPADTPADIRAALDAVDTRLKALEGR